MNNKEENNKNNVDTHQNDLIMPGFRFHPTEEELIDFYLRRKIEGKHFNVELISFLDLYNYDPWQLPEMAAIGEKEWFFYVPRDRKYRNGDRPNRVTSSGYWKATGADRMIRNENLKCIGLKKTLVFYFGKAPKGVRSCWIMNEYRLPHSEIDRFVKTEISLCRVYKRSGVVENRRLPPSKPSSLTNSSSFSMLQEQNEAQKFDQNQVIVQQHELYPTSTNSLLEEDHPKSSINLPCTEVSMANETVDELQRLVGYNNQSFVQQNNEIQQVETSNYQLVHPPTLNTVPISLSTISEKLWEWNANFNNFQ